METSARAHATKVSTVRPDESFPPQSSRSSEIETITEFVKSVASPRGATYVSAPIASGLLFVDWVKREGRALRADPAGYRRELFNGVVRPNRERVRLLIGSLREGVKGPVIDPTAVGYIDGWTQGDYRTAWAKVIEHFVHTVVLADGWEFSSGCSYEFLVATQSQVRTLDERGAPISVVDAIERIEQANRELDSQGVPNEFLRGLLDELRSVGGGRAGYSVTALQATESSSFKDEVLDELARHGNVAQFVSFDPNLSQRFSRVLGHEPNVRFKSTADAIRALLEASSDHSVNVRSYHPESSKGREFVYGLRSLNSALEGITRLAGQGLFTIVNETIDVSDGGVSGVSMGDLVEFAPGDTPRCVEKPGTAALSRSVALTILGRVYGFEVTLPFGRWRIEFSIHPLPRGFRGGHTILWELEPVERAQAAPAVHWPNNFSRLLGDKTFGLLIADAYGFAVPETLVVPRALAPFRFGRPTGSGEKWLRTAPPEPVPGRYSTFRGWRDPFKLLEAEDPTGQALASVLAQDGVVAEFSGAALQPQDGQPLIEGVKGAGADFMIGREAAALLPEDVRSAVANTCQALVSSVGPGFKIEWAFDSGVLWIIQLQRSDGTIPGGRVVVSGNATEFREFNVDRGIDDLRQLIDDVRRSGSGILLRGAVGLTSHFGDLLRRNNIPSRIEP